MASSVWYVYPVTIRHQAVKTRVLSAVWRGEEAPRARSVRVEGCEEAGNNNKKIQLIHHILSSSSIERCHGQKDKFRAA